MAKKKDEKDVLVVRDEKTGEISVVAGLNADGSPKRIPAKAENSQSFLQFDRHGDVLDNFFKNFFRQCKEPSRFGFYRVAADQADKLLEVIKDLLKDPEGNKEMLAPHKVDTSGYEKKVQEEQSAEKQEQPEQNYYSDFAEKGYYNRIIAGNINQVLKVDSVVCDFNGYPYRAVTYATQKIIRQSNVTERSLVTTCRLLNSSRSDDNPNGFTIEGFTIIENKDLQTIKR